MKKKTWIKTKSTHDASLGIIRNVGALLEFPIEKKAVLQDLLSHPDHPSMLAMSDVMMKYGIKNQGVLVEKDYLKEISLPFVTELENDEALGGVIVTNIENDKVEYLDPKNGYIVENIDFFKEKWYGPALLIDAASKPVITKESKPSATLIFNNIVTYTLPLTLFVSQSAIFLSQNNFTGLLVSLLLILGTLICNFLIHDERMKFDIAMSFCGKLSNYGCQRVLNSKLAKIFKVLGLSEIGLVCFLANSILLLLAAIYKSNIYQASVLIGATSVAGVAFSFVALYHQLKISKSWCLLCNLIAVINWALLATIVMSLSNIYPHFPVISPGDIVVTINVYLTVLLVGTTSRQWINISIRQAEERKKLNHLYGSPWFFETLKLNGTKETEPYESNELVFGNPEANHQAIVVLSPQCFRCRDLYLNLKQAHEDNKILDYKIVLRMIMFHPADAGQSLIFKMILPKFMFKNETTSEKIRVFDDCYKYGMDNPEKWMEVSSSSNEDYIEKEIERLTHWMEINEIKYTPTLIIDGHFVPPAFYNEYLKLMISHP